MAQARNRRSAGVSSRSAKKSVLTFGEVLDVLEALGDSLHQLPSTFNWETINGAISSAQEGLLDAGQLTEQRKTLCGKGISLRNLTSAKAERPVRFPINIGSCHYTRLWGLLRFALSSWKPSKSEITPAGKKSLDELRRATLTELNRQFILATAHYFKSGSQIPEHENFRDYRNTGKAITLFHEMEAGMIEIGESSDSRFVDRRAFERSYLSPASSAALDAADELAKKHWAAEPIDIILLALLRSDELRPLFSQRTLQSRCDDLLIVISSAPKSSENKRHTDFRCTDIAAELFYFAAMREKLSGQNIAKEYQCLTPANLLLSASSLCRLRGSDFAELYGAGDALDWIRNALTPSDTPKKGEKEFAFLTENN